MSPEEISYWFSNEVKPLEGELRGFLHHRLDQKADVDDIVQESFRRIIEVRRSRNVDSVKGLLFTIARNILNDLFRKKYAAQTSFVEDLDGLNVVSKEITPTETLSREDDTQALMDSIQALPRRCRTIMILRKIENRSHREIAEQLNISTSTVETQLTRGLRRCRKFLEKRGVTFPSDADS